MIEIGKIQKLIIARQVPFGAYLAEKPDADAGRTVSAGHAGGVTRGRKDGRVDNTEITEVLLPGSQLPEGAKTGDMLEVFIYRDSEDRPVATVRRPALTVGEAGRLKVLSVTKIGAFLDWGLEKDLLLPYHEQRGDSLRPGDEVLCAVYEDKSGRLCATMNVYHYLRNDAPYKAGDTVTGTVYETSGNFGTFVAVDDIYSALIPKQELVRPLKPGETVTARVSRVREDGRLNLSLRDKAYIQMDKDAEKLLTMMRENGGQLLLHDRSDPELIRRSVNMSKNEFKRAAGRLLKQGKIRILEDRIVLEEEM